MQNREGEAQASQGTSKAQEEIDVSDERESEQEATGGEVEEVVDEEDCSIALRGDEIAMNENDIVRIPEGFVHEDAVMAEALQSWRWKHQSSSI